MFKIIPREEKFFDMFEEAAKNIYEGARLLLEMMENYTEVEERVKKIQTVEQKGDTITHDIIRKLNQTFITPIDREDIYSLSSSLDDVLDFIEAVADRMVVFKIQKPTPEAIKLSRIIFESAQEIVKAILQLKSMKQIYGHCVEVNRLENEADRITRDAIARLFEEVQNPIEVIKWKEIYENLEIATDRCEDVANILERIVLKHT
ncbi:MAG TPA: DUF47 family protein [Candidatus Manganitrophaceae bacterium]|nr:DUF47 family protein [Candidatus Manganitrophaceae bacterium]